MGCICSKGIPANDYVAENHSKERHLKSNRSSRHGASLRKEESVLHSDGGQSDAMARLILNQHGEENAGSTSESDDAEKATPIGKAASAKPLRQEQRPSMEDGEKRVGVHNNNNNATPRIIGVVIGEKGALVIAGWPSWLTSVAGEAINGWVPRKADSFQKLDKVSFSSFTFYMLYLHSFLQYLFTYALVLFI